MRDPVSQFIKPRCYGFDWNVQTAGEGAVVGQGDDLIQLQVLTHPARLLFFRLGSELITNETCQVSLIRRGTAGANGTAKTEVPYNSDDAAAASQIVLGNTVVGSNLGVLASWQWEQVGPLEFYPPPDMQIHVLPGRYLALNIGLLAHDTRFYGTFAWQEG